MRCQAAQLPALDLAGKNGPTACAVLGKQRARLTTIGQQRHKKPLVDIKKTHFAALQKIILQCERREHI
jgi:hypothetical protein